MYMYITASFENLKQFCICVNVNKQFIAIPMNYKCKKIFTKKEVGGDDSMQQS